MGKRSQNNGTTGSGPAAATLDIPSSHIAGMAAVPDGARSPQDARMVGAGSFGSRRTVELDYETIEQTMSQLQLFDRMHKMDRMKVLDKSYLSCAS